MLKSRFLKVLACLIGAKVTPVRLDATVSLTPPSLSLVPFLSPSPSPVGFDDLTKMILGCLQSARSQFRTWHVFSLFLLISLFMLLSYQVEQPWERTCPSISGAAVRPLHWARPSHLPGRSGYSWCGIWGTSFWRKSFCRRRTQMA